uniref:Uncharacterized protein n=1 Tax=Romanomermis culicivorax TaxID=13658 RepID=A0A915I3X6_ROMCU
QNGDENGDDDQKIADDFDEIIRLADAGQISATTTLRPPQSSNEMPRTPPQPFNEMLETTPQPSNESAETSPQPSNELLTTSPQPSKELLKTPPQPSNEFANTLHLSSDESAMTTLQPSNEPARSSPQPSKEMLTTTPQLSNESLQPYKEMQTTTMQPSNESPQPSNEMLTTTPQPSKEMLKTSPQPSDETLTTPPQPFNEMLETTPHPSNESAKTLLLPSDESVETSPQPSNEMLTTLPQPPSERLETTPQPSNESAKTLRLPSDVSVNTPPQPSNESRLPCNESPTKPPKLSTIFSPYKSSTAENSVSADFPPKMESSDVRKKRPAETFDVGGKKRLTSTEKDEIVVISSSDEETENSKTLAENLAKKIAERFLKLKKQIPWENYGRILLMDVFRNALENVGVDNGKSKTSTEFFRRPSAFYEAPSRIVDLIVEYPSRKSWADFKRELQISQETGKNDSDSDFKLLSPQTHCPNLTRRLLNVGLENVQSYVENCGSKLILIERNEIETKNPEIFIENLISTKSDKKSRKRKRRTSSESSTASCSTTTSDGETTSSATPIGRFDVQISVAKKFPPTENVHVFPPDVVVHKCPVRGCRFVADTLIGLENHREAPHKSKFSRQYLCAMCDQKSAATIYQSQRLSDKKMVEKVQFFRLLSKNIEFTIFIPKFMEEICIFCQRRISRKFESHVTNCEKKYVAWYEKNSHFTLPPILYVSRPRYYKSSLMDSSHAFTGAVGETAAAAVVPPPLPLATSRKEASNKMASSFRKERDYLLENFKLKPINETQLKFKSFELELKEIFKNAVQLENGEKRSKISNFETKNGGKKFIEED